jgi:pimeloyl-ACP methyl ester carboxylesterase
VDSSPNPRPIQLYGEGEVPITVWDHGGTGNELLLVHCTGTHGRVWDPIVARLGSLFHVYAIDTRGHGDSGKPEHPEQYRWGLSGRDLLIAIDALKLKSGLLAAGHSAGAAHIAYAEWFRPGTFSSVVLIDPIIGPKEAFRGPNALAERSRRRKNVLPSLAGARERFASKPPMDAWDRAVLDAYVQHGFYALPDGAVALKCPGHVEAMIYEGSGASDVFEHLHELKFRALLVTSDASDVRHLALAQKPRFPDAQFRQISGASHFIPQEKPDLVAELLIEWLRPTSVSMD